MNTNNLPIALPGIQRKIVILLSFLCFVVPFLLPGNQVLTGTLVNASLFLSAALLPTKFFFPLIVLPSLASLSRGVIFGPLTPFLYFFIPFIWLGNLSLIFVFRKTNVRLGSVLGIFLASMVKALFLFAFAHLYFTYKIVPQVFLTTMGINQFYTALLGGLVAIFILKKDDYRL